MQSSNFSLEAIFIREFSSKKDKFCIDFIGKPLAYLSTIAFLWALGTFCDRTGLKKKIYFCQSDRFRLFFHLTSTDHKISLYTIIVTPFDEKDDVFSSNQSWPINNKNFYSKRFEHLVRGADKNTFISLLFCQVYL